jgi:hypothetical protein
MPNLKVKNSGSPNKPYFVPFQRVLENVTYYTKSGYKADFSFGVDKPVERYARVILDQIKKSAWKGIGWATRDRLGDAYFPLASQTPQLQAADLFSYLSYRHMQERLAANDWLVLPTGLLGTCLHRMNGYDHGYETKDSLQITLDRSYAAVGNWDGH